MNIPDQNLKPQPHVVLIHGIGGSRVVMWPLARTVKRAGFACSIFGYRSWLWSIEKHAKDFTQCLDRIEKDPAISEFNIVGHSMGTIITRQTLLQKRYEKLNRIVMLAPPNLGSPVARVLGNAIPFCKTLRQLSNRSGSYVRNLPDLSSENLGTTKIGIVAAQYDRVVPDSNSQLESASDRVVIFSGHNGLLTRPTAGRHVVEFLSHGWFEKNLKTVQPSASNSDTSQRDVA